MWIRSAMRYGCHRTVQSSEGLLRASQSQQKMASQMSSKAMCSSSSGSSRAIGSSSKHVLRRGFFGCATTILTTGGYLSWRSSSLVRAEVVSLQALDSETTPSNGESIEETLRVRSRHWLRKLLRACALALRWTPLVLLSPLLWIRREWWWQLFLTTIESSGPCFIKLAQWASTRADLMPIELVLRCSTLHAHCKTHDYVHTEKAMAESFGVDWGNHITLEPTPVGSGAIAQVYRGTLRADDGTSETVAVKVCHPGTRNEIEMDLGILDTLVKTLEMLIPSTKVFSGQAVVSQFCEFMLSQNDLRKEADNLERFRQDFPEGEGHRLTFPKVKHPWVSAEVLVESFEEGELLKDIIIDSQRAIRTYSRRRMSSFNLEIAPQTKMQEELPDEDQVKELVKAKAEMAQIAVYAYISMLFDKNFVHADLHPGNVLVNRRPTVKLSFLDCGLCVRVNARDARNFADVLYYIIKGNPNEVGRLMAERAPGDHSLHVDVDGFALEVGNLIQQTRRAGFSFGKIRLGELFGTVNQLAMKHRIMLEPNFVNIVVSLGVLEGTARELAPDLDLFQKFIPYLIRASPRLALLALNSDE